MIPVLKYLLHIGPRLLVNAGLFWIYSLYNPLPRDLWWVHLFLIASLLVLSDLLLRRWAHRLAARNQQAALWLWTLLHGLRDVAITPLYLLSFISMKYWHDVFFLENLLCAHRNLAGLVSLFGTKAYLGALALVLILLGWVAWRLFTARRGFHAFASHLGAERGKLSSHPDVLLFVLLLVPLNVAMLSAEDGWIYRLRKDPVLAFYIGHVEDKVNPTVIARDIEERASYPSGLSHRKADVILIGVDCLRADHLPAYGYARNTTPQLDAFAREQGMGRIGLALSAGNQTKYGVFGTFGSRFTQNQHPKTFKIYEVLKRQGYRNYFISTGDKTRFMEMGKSYGEGLDLLYDGLSSSKYDMFDDDQILDVVSGLPDRGDTPAFFYFHLSSAHDLGMKKKEFIQWKTPAPTHAQKSRDAYDNGILTADDTIMRLLALLARKGYMKDYLLFIDGDHGEGLGEDGHFGHGDSLALNQVWIPLLWKDSALEKTPDYPIASQVDIAPTILEHLGLPIPSSWEGLPFHKVAFRKDTFVATPGSVGWQALLRPEEDNLYYLLHTGADGQLREEAYRLGAELRQKENIWGTLPLEKRLELRETLRKRFPQ